ncbi:hypothetical protein GQ55_6G248500 [Panicum hallii var. hallii]|uniref:Protein kinase domain-containing protein n=1 Tax=Panicum hallii var. hallii TaxID=1504633 RepID=A0A2T7D9A2_9POAL|nr:hypothetical protein GQ55_6G248500 [Panicum hallii var. hallii]
MRLELHSGQVKHILPNYGSLTGGTRPRSRTATWWPSSALGRRSPRDTRTSRPRRRCSAGSATPTCWLSGPANLGPKGEKLLVFDYMPKGSLTSFLHRQSSYPCYVLCSCSVQHY